MNTQRDLSIMESYCIYEKMIIIYIYKEVLMNKTVQDSVNAS